MDRGTGIAVGLGALVLGAAILYGRKVSAATVVPQPPRLGTRITLPAETVVEITVTPIEGVSLEEALSEVEKIPRTALSNIIRDNVVFFTTTSQVITFNTGEFLPGSSNLKIVNARKMLKVR
jgi:hypothetical protein